MDGGRSAQFEVDATEDEGPTVAAIYARTSSPNQKFNHSIEEQINQCWEYCNERAWAVGYVFIDECQSGKSVERPKFKLMLEKARAGMFDVIVFWKLDRFCRSLADLVNVEKALRQWNVGLCSVTEYIDTTTPVGRFNFRSLASVAELERELIGERARLGLYALARELRWPNPHPPLGYDKCEDGKLMVNEEEARLVGRIFSMYIRERSMPQVAFQLNREGVRTKRGREWTTRAIREILTNEIYIGRYRVAGFESEAEEYRIVSDEVFKRAKETMLRYRTGKAERPPMPEERRAAKIENMLRKYYVLLGELWHENFSED